MKKLASLLFICLLIFACKNTSEEKEEEVSTSPEIETAPSYDTQIELSLAQWSLHKPIFAGTEDPMDFAQTAKDLGFTGLEYVSQLYTGDDVSFPMKDAGLQAILEGLKKRSDSLNMQNLLIMIDGEGDLSFNDEEATAEAIENHKKWIDAAQYLGCHSIRVNLFGEEDPEAWVANSVRSLKALCTYAADKNVSVIVENHGGLSSNGKLLARVMEEVNMKNCGTLPDFGNFCIKREGGARWGAPCVEEYDIYQGIAEIMPYAKGVSAKAYAFNEEGDETKIDYYKMLQLVKDANFMGYVGVEYEGDEPLAGIEATKNLVLKAAQKIK